MTAFTVCPHCAHFLTLEEVDKLVDGTLAEIVDDALDVRAQFTAARIAAKAMN